ncbi:MAG TPA: dUTP diphosphatase [Fimbriimonadaceae bacterium]|nr:dUTP diphosphatase [Fimbriimonadaceae bacterium]
MKLIPVPVTLGEGAVMPVYKTTGSAGMDLCASEDVHLGPLARALVPTGLRVAIPEGYEGQVRPRSGLALKHGIGMVNAPGTIDSDYRGEVKVLLINLGSEDVSLMRGERIAQLVICPIARAEMIPMDRLEETERGEGGFGSTGR